MKEPCKTELAEAERRRRSAEDAARTMREQLETPLAGAERLQGSAELAARATKEGLAAQLADATRRLNSAEASADAAWQGAAAALAQCDRIQQQLDAILASTVWRSSWPIRRLFTSLPDPARRYVRAGARMALRAVTFHNNKRPIERLRTPTPAGVAKARVSDLSDLRRADQTTIGEATIELAIERLRSFAAFSAADYVAGNLDVRSADVDPYRHAICHGLSEGRKLCRGQELARLLGELDRRQRFSRASEVSPEPATLATRLGPVAVFANTRGNAFMRDIAENLVADLLDLGVAAELRDENSSIEARPRVAIYVAPHEFFTLGRGKQWVSEDILGSGFMFSTEQLQTSWFALSLPFILMSRGVIDLCYQNVQLLNETRIPALHLFPSSRLSGSVLTDADREHFLYRVLPDAAKVDGHRDVPFNDRPIDVAFFGTESPRRHKFFARQAALFADFENFIYSRPLAHGPMSAIGSEAALPRIAAHVSRHAKITLNIHRDEFGYFEWHRMVELGMARGSVVVSDPCLPQPLFRPGTHYFEETTANIPNLIEWLLRSAEGRKEAERVRSNAVSTVVENLTSRQATLQLATFLAEHAAQ
jgi:hypothetical protein